MGQSYGKFTVPHSTSKAHKAQVAESPKDNAGDIMNGSLQVSSDIPHITEPDVSEEEQTEELPNSRNNSESHNGEVKDSTIIKKCKKRAASWKTKTLNLMNSTPNKQQSVETVSKTDENNNIEINKTHDSLVDSPKVEESTTDKLDVEAEGPINKKKSKSSFKALMKRASSLTSKKNRTSVGDVNKQEIKTAEVVTNSMTEDQLNTKEEMTTELPHAVIEHESSKDKTEGLSAEEKSLNTLVAKETEELTNGHADEEKAELSMDKLDDLEKVITNGIANLKVGEQTTTNEVVAEES